MSVLGWPPGSVPGDENAAATHRIVTGLHDETIAVVSSMPHPCPDRPGEPSVYLWALAVSPNHQRSGVGTSLVQQILAQAAQDGASVVWADARESAVEFYERLGAVAGVSSSPDSVTGLDGRRVIFTLRQARA